MALVSKCATLVALQLKWKNYSSALMAPSTMSCSSSALHLANLITGLEWDSKADSE